jgi:hypothetical protein
MVSVVVVKVSRYQSAWWGRWARRWLRCSEWWVIGSGYRGSGVGQRWGR